MGRTLTLTFAVIDDDSKFCRQFCRVLSQISKSNDLSPWAEMENSLELKFIPVFPEKRSTKEGFLNKLNDFFSLKLDDLKIKNLTGAIIDLSLDFQDGSEHLSGTYIAQLMKRKMPHLMRVLLTNYDPDQAIATNPGLFDWPQRKDSLMQEEEQKQFAERLIEGVAQRYATPFWTGLQQYTKRTKIVLHAMANSDARVGKKSVTIDDFSKVFGRGYFRSEASSTSAPLDSLLHPVSSILAAEQSAARAFGARAARFVTNGTTTSNKIVHQFASNSGSIVLIDRFCHISHHYAVCMSRASPIYLPADINSVSEIPHQISPEAISSVIDSLLSHGGSQARLPALIAITNCTFDGIAVKPASIFYMVKEVLKRYSVEERIREIVFLFDEAWFGYSRFHPKYVDYSAHAARERLADEDPWWDSHLRVYVTQSVHKTLVSFRQGSVILFTDPELDDSAPNHAYMRQRLDNAFAAHTTTSPHSGIIASLDVGRRHILLEGQTLLNDVLALAGEFRQFIQDIGREFELESGEPSLSVCEEGDLISESNADHQCLDPLKITIRTNGWISGKELRNALWRDHSVQVNKYGPDSILCIFTIGITRQDVSDLKNMIRSLLISNKTKLSKRKRVSKLRNPFPSNEFSFQSVRGGIVKFELENVGNEQSQRYDPGLHLSGTDQNLVEVKSIGEIETSSETFASAGFVVPYPPGYPILVPGQIVTKETARWISDQAGREIHGIVEEAGVFSLAVTKAREE